MNLKRFFVSAFNLRAQSTQLWSLTAAGPDTNSIHHPPCVVVFGRPGAGKTTVADAAVAMLSSSSEQDISCLGLDLDVCVPQWMRDNFANGIYPTLQERQAFAIECCDYVEKQVENYKKEDNPNELATIVSFSFVNTDLRDVFRSRFPHAKWILIDTQENEATRRITMREGHFYKGVKKIDGSDQKEDNLDTDVRSDKYNDNDENTKNEWNFAPVTFDHVILDGTETVEVNAKRVVQVMQEIIGVSC